ncbi:hypothetical protein [Streptomyces physcomitrii]|uniref:Uncharacterized protein n=1 Tax=Streptomyces physcomitrii TaxID=2724184 RepID=A0ABX1GX57_9ACTN|nr:hypothetical protein [Streptomyces physcomitrii]NKI40674.1 hypothetical protein [Streptomyces physcomitrii]
MPESVTLSILDVFPPHEQNTKICVVRCLEGTALLGMSFRVDPSLVEVEDISAHLTLEKIEWYGKSVEQLDTVHSGRVTVKGLAAEWLTPGTMLKSVGSEG